VGRVLPDRRLTTFSRPPGTISTTRRYDRIETETRRDLSLVLQTLEAHKAGDVVVLDLRKISNVADFFVIASGTSDTHVRTLAERVLEAVERSDGHAHHVEGLQAGRWALLDFVDIVVHVFHPSLREYYQLERLWADAPLVSADRTSQA